MPSTRSAGAMRQSPAIKVMTTLVFAVSLAGCMAAAQSSRELDYSRTRSSESGIYRGRITPEGDSIPTGRLQRWMLHLETANGAPVDVATVRVDGGMPQHGHGLPTRPQVTRALGDGNHLVEGMKFNMAGWWIVKFHVNSAAGSDSLVFNLSL
jgi:YtkA-like